MFLSHRREAPKKYQKREAQYRRTVGTPLKPPLCRKIDKFFISISKKNNTFDTEKSFTRKMTFLTHSSNMLRWHFSIFIEQITFSGGFVTNIWKYTIVGPCDWNFMHFAREGDNFDTIEFWKLGISRLLYFCLWCIFTFIFMPNWKYNTRTLVKLVKF